MRTEKWARAKGLVYTGISSRSTSECVTRCADLRLKGYQAFVCSWPHDPLARGGGSGCSVFAEKRWAYDQEEARITKELNELPARRELARKELEYELKKLEARENELNYELAGLRVKQMGGPW